MELRFSQPRFTCQTIPAQAAFNRILKISNLHNENVRKPVNVQILVIAKTFRTCESLVRNRCCSQVTSGVWKQAAADWVNHHFKLSTAHVENPCKTLIITLVNHSHLGVLVQRLERLTYNKVRLILWGVCMLSTCLFSLDYCWSYLKSPIM